MINDKDKSKEELIQELEGLRQRLAGLVKAGQTEHQRIEQELKNSEQKYRTVFQHSPDYIYLNDLDGFFIDGNPATLEVHGLSLEEFQKKSFLDFFAGDNLGELIRVSEGLREGRPVFGLKLRIRGAGDRILELEINAVPLFEDGRVTSILSLARDITARVNAETKLKQAYDEMETRVTQRTVELLKVNQELRAEIVERQRAEAALQESEELYRTLVETSPDMIGLLDLEGRIRFMNRRLKAALGVQRKEDFAGRKVTDLISPAEQEKAEANIRRASRGSFNRSNEYLIHLPDGSRAIWETTSTLIRDAGGKPKAILSINRDVTEQRKAEQALRESEELYRTLVETSPDVVTMVDPEGRIIYGSPRIYETYGYEKEEDYLGKNIMDFIPPEARERVKANLEKTAREERSAPSEYPMIRKDGTPITLEASSAPIRDAAGRVKAFLSVSRDITARKRAEEALKESEEMYRTLVETSPDAIVSTDMEMRITEASQRALELFGTDKKKDLIGKIFLELTDPKDRRDIQRKINRSLRGKVVRNVELVFSRINGTNFIGEANAALLKDASGTPTGFLVSIRDISERKRMEKEILEIAARERRRIGHDLHDGLGQHLTAISFMNKVLENKLAAECPAEAREAAKISKLISEAITQSRDLSRGINPVEPRSDGLMVSLRQLSANLERIFKVSCLFQCPRRVLVNDNIISTNLYYIAQEATSNAIRHGKARQVKIRLAVVRDKLTLNVSDDGVGIPEDFKINGGLGLQIMDYRAKILGANLSIQPGRKSGTTVTCSLRAPAKSLH